jgi:hypothetical protein
MYQVLHQRSSDDTETIDDTMEEAVLDEVVGDGEDADYGLMSENNSET